LGEKAEILVAKKSVIDFIEKFSISLSIKSMALVKITKVLYCKNIKTNQKIGIDLFI
jgi:hypothetical protein